MIDSLKAAVAKTINVFREEVSSVRAKLEAAKRRREDLLVAPLSRSDITALLFAYVDRQANQYPEDLGRSIKELHHERSFKTGESAASRAGEFVAGGVLTPTGNGPRLDRTLMFLLRNEVKKGIASAVEQIKEWPENTGPALKERADELATPETEIKALEGRMRELAEEHAKIANSFR